VLVARQRRHARHLAVVDDGRVAAAERLRELGVLVEKLGLAVHGQEVLRPDDLEQLRELVGARVAAARVGVAFRNVSFRRFAASLHCNQLGACTCLAPAKSVRGARLVCKPSARSLQILGPRCEMRLNILVTFLSLPGMTFAE
jgi:hypothetical protein